MQLKRRSKRGNKARSLGHYKVPTRGSKYYGKKSHKM